MLILVNFLYIVVGILLLYFGGDLLVDNSVKIAKKFNLPSFLIGAVIVGFGTSLPEFFVSFLASMTGNHDISLGNVIGSNITNVLLILGLVSFIFPVPISRKTLLFDMLPLLFAYILFFFFIINIKGLSDMSNLENLIKDSKINHIEGLIMFLFMLLYLGLSYKFAKPDNSLEEEDDTNSSKINIGLCVALILVSLGMLLAGSQVLIMGAKYIAKDIFGISDRVIGLTVVAIGTSLPELSASLVASIKKEFSVSLGNIIGSNMFNILMILGVTSLFFEIHTTDLSFAKDFIVMSVGMLLLMFFGLIFKKLPRIGGLIFLVGYITYTIYIIKMG